MNLQYIVTISMTADECANGNGHEGRTPFGFVFDQPPMVVAIEVIRSHLTATATTSTTEVVVCLRGQMTAAVDVRVTIEGGPLRGISSESVLGELQDLSDVHIVAALNNDLLAFDEISGLWTNQAAGEAGLATAGHSHTVNASAVVYTPGVLADWDGDADPGNTDDALDQLAERVDDLEGAAVDAAAVTYTPTVLTDWDADADPGNTGDALDQLAERVDDLEAAHDDAANITYTPSIAADWDSSTDPGDVNDALDQLAARVDDVEGIARYMTLVFCVPGTLAIGAQPLRLHVPNAATVVNVTAAVATAPTGASLIVDIHKNGVTIFTTQANRPTITTGNTEDLTSVPDVTALALNDVLTLEIDAVGSGVAGADLVVQVRCTL